MARLSALLLWLVLLVPHPVLARAAHGITVVSDEALSERLHELTLHSQALERETNVRVLLPTGYDPDADVDHPVLFLLHGASGSSRDWTNNTDLEAFTAGMDLIVVMPDAGTWGFYTDWFNNGVLGQPKWESHHIGELVPWVPEHYDACNRRACRIIIGLSMGGFGSFSYASRHPDLFVAAAAFSGAVDTTIVDPVGGTALSLIEVALGQTPPGSLWGQFVTEEVRWRGDNPWDLAPNLAHTELEMRTGNGQPGGEFGGDFDPLEAGVHIMNTSLHERLTTLGINHGYEDYGPGAHAWPYWERDLHLTLPHFLEVIAEDRPAPEVFSHRFIEPTVDIHGWQVDLDRAVLEFAELRDASDDGFALVGTGAAVVTTPPVHAPGELHELRVGSATHEIRATDGGRLVIPVDLGPANLFQQYTATADALEAALGDGYLRQVEVVIATAPGDGAPPDAEGPAGRPDSPTLPATGGGLALGLLLALAAGRRRGSARLSSR